MLYLHNVRGSVTSDLIRKKGEGKEERKEKIVQMKNRKIRNKRSTLSYSTSEIVDNYDR